MSLCWVIFSELFVKCACSLIKLLVTYNQSLFPLKDSIVSSRSQSCSPFKAGVLVNLNDIVRGLKKG